MAKITASAPVLLVKDVVLAAAYFRDKLGFTEQTLYNEPPSFAIIRRDGFRRAVAGRCRSRFVPNWRIVEKMWDVYFWVDDVECDLCRISGQRRDHRLTPCTTPWGVREFGVQDIDDHDIAFGQIIR